MVRLGGVDWDWWYPEAARGRSLLMPSPPTPTTTRMIWPLFTPTPPTLLPSVHTGNIQVSSAKSGRRKKYVFSQTSASPPSHVGSAERGVQDGVQAPEWLGITIPGKTVSSPTTPPISSEKAVSDGERSFLSEIGREDKEWAGDSGPGRILRPTNTVNQEQAEVGAGTWEERSGPVVSNQTSLLVTCSKQWPSWNVGEDTRRACWTSSESEVRDG